MLNTRNSSPSSSTQLADRHYIIEQGAIVHEASNEDFMADDAVKDRYLGVGMA